MALQLKDAHVDRTTQLSNDTIEAASRNLNYGITKQWRSKFALQVETMKDLDFENGIDKLIQDKPKDVEEQYSATHIENIMTRLKTDKVNAESRESLNFLL